MDYEDLKRRADEGSRWVYSGLYMIAPKATHIMLDTGE